MLPDLSSQGIALWSAMLPPELQLCLDDGQPSAEPAPVFATLLASTAPSALSALLRGHFDDAAAMGRARRVRLLAFLAANADMASLVVQDDEDGGQGSGDLFFADMKAVLAALAPRIGRSRVAAMDAAAALDAAHTLESDFSLEPGALV